MSISVLVVSYNEQERILNVLAAISQVKEISQVIVVDDGSDSQSRSYLKQAKEKYPHFLYIRHPHNLGKTAALKTGFLNSKGDALFLLDADLRGLTPKHIQGMIQAYLEFKPDMLLSERAGSSWFYRVSGIETAYTGERIIPKTLLIKHQDVFLQSRYLFEAALNMIFFRKYQVVKYRWDGVKQTYKPQKRGIKGFFEDVKMIIGMIKWMGIGEFFWQINKARNLKSV